MKREEAIEIYKEESKRFESTRSIQWKFNIGIWTVLALAIQFKEQIGFKYYEHFHCFCYQLYLIHIAVLASIVILVIHCWFTYMIQVSLTDSKAVKDVLNKELNNRESKNEDIQVIVKDVHGRHEGNFYAWIILEASITLFLLLIFWFKIS